MMKKYQVFFLLAAGAAAYYIWQQHQTATILDNRYPMAYR
jgi:hypothetical protein